jgi:hypothetical protein
VLVLANKQEVPSALTADEIKTRLGVGAPYSGDSIPSASTPDGSPSDGLLAEKGRVRLECHVQPCSALDGKGLYEGLDWLIAQLEA